jgi:cytochrome P450
MDVEIYQGRDDLIIDEMLSVFVGAIKTTQSTTTNLICYMDMNPHIKAKLLEEIRPPLEEVKDDILGELKFETVSEFDYLQKVIYETLRIEPALKLPAGSCMAQDCVLNGVTVKKETILFVNFWNIHRDPRQWREPTKFEPERFNTQSEWYKTPDGKPRHPLAWCPFLGGKRICVGKTFAEVVLRYVVPILYHHFDFELANPEHRINKPPVNFNSTASSVIPVKLTVRNPVVFKEKQQ